MTEDTTEPHAALTTCPWCGDPQDSFAGMTPDAFARHYVADAPRELHLPPPGNATATVCDAMPLQKERRACL
jgi:hypothetical protein